MQSLEEFEQALRIKLLEGAADLEMAMDEITFREAMEEAQRRRVEHEYGSGEFGLEGVVVLSLSDGAFLVFRSSYEPDPSDDTPGGGLEPPRSFFVSIRRR